MVFEQGVEGDDVARGHIGEGLDGVPILIVGAAADAHGGHRVITHRVAQQGGVDHVVDRVDDVDGEDVTTKVLNCNGRIALLCINDADAIDGSANRAIEHLYSLYPASAIYVVSATEVDIKLPSPHLLVDAMTLRSIIRSDVGIVVLRDGVVEYKDSI